jgi:hypothetical protein
MQGSSNSVAYTVSTKERQRMGGRRMSAEHTARVSAAYAAHTRETRGAAGPARAPHTPEKVTAPWQGRVNAHKKILT